MSARGEAKRREAREYAGLDPSNSYVNPHRELQSGTTLDYIEAPDNKTRSEMRSKRKQTMREEMQQTRREGAEDYVPMAARHTCRDSTEYDLRRPQENAMTLNKLRQQRKIEQIEYNMKNFHQHLRHDDQAKFSEQEKAWWTMANNYVPEPAACTLKSLNESSKEVTGKVTETIVPIREAVEVS